MPHVCFTAVFRQVPEGHIAFAEELPGANTQGATLEEARANLAEAIEMVLDANRALAEKDLTWALPTTQKTENKLRNFRTE